MPARSGLNRWLSLAATLLFFFCLRLLSYPDLRVLVKVVEASSPDMPSVSSAMTATASLTDTLLFDGNLAYSVALTQCAMGPRVTGTPQGWATGDFIAERLRSYGWTVSEQPFSYKGVAGRNVIGSKGSGPMVMLGAHYDTRPIADLDPKTPKQPIIGGNDGASGVAVLLELARVLDMPRVNKQVQLAFFDAEDRGNIDGWPFSVGAEYLAAHLTETPQCVLVVDMVGDRDQGIYWETRSNRVLLHELWGIAADLGYARNFIPEYKWGLTDDHVPFLNRGIPAVDIIDFDYPAWHTTDDTCDKIGPESLGRVGHVLQVWLEGKSSFLAQEDKLKSGERGASSE